MPASGTIGRHALHKLTDEQVAHIRLLAASSSNLPLRHPGRWSYVRLMEEFGVSRDTLWRVLTRRRYAWVR